MSQMQDFESIELYTDSLKKAASICRQLKRLSNDKVWEGVAAGFDRLRAQGNTLYTNTTPSRSDILEMLDNIVSKEAAKQEKKDE